MKRTDYKIRIFAGAIALAICALGLFSCTMRGRDMLGDCNGDGAVNAVDSNYLGRSVHGELVFLLEKNADINGDGIINDADISLLREYHAGSYLPGERFSHIYLNGMDIKNYSIVIPENNTDFEMWTAQILQESIKDLSGEQLSIYKDSDESQTYEILIGKTNRNESYNVTAAAGQYLIYSHSTKIILRGEDYYIAGGAGHIISLLEDSDTPWNSSEYLEIPRDAKSYSPKWKEAKNVLFFIGDGMGLNHTRMASDSDCRVEYASGNIVSPDEKGFEVFWPSTFDNIGESITLNIQNSTTDSAAGATALSTGYKTLNGALGMIPADLDGDGEENEFRTVQNVREAATLSGKATGILSTDKQTGATPNAFLIHHYTRKDRDIILRQQTALDMTRLACNYLWCSYDSNDAFDELRDAIDTCDDNPGGFFIMMEEAMIDKYGEKMDYDNVIRTVKRLNHMMAYAATYAMCHRDTVVILTADHETGGLTLGEDDVWRWTSDGEHTGTNVPVFAMGYGTEIFNENTCDNTAIAKFIFNIVE